MNTPKFDFSIFREGLAELEHEQWCAWAEDILQQEPGLSDERRDRWNRLIALDWEDLSDDDKRLDYEIADRVLRELRDDAFNNLVLIAEYILESVYPESIFTGKSADIGPKFTVALRKTLKDVKKVIEERE